MRRFQRWIYASLISMAAGAVATGSVSILHVVKDGVPGALRYEQSPWKVDPLGGLSERVPENILYADGVVGAGDFRIEATLVIDDPGVEGAAFVINEYNIFGFSGYKGHLYTKGRILGTRLLPIAAEELVKPGVPFRFLAERIGDRFRVSMDGTQVFETDFRWRWGGETGFRNVRILDFSVTADFLPLSEYLMNSPFHGKDLGPVEIAPVVLPEGHNLVQNNWHFGWPVAAQSGDALVAVFQRTQHHHGSHRPALSGRSTAVVVRSLDGGRSWSDPLDLKGVVKEEAAHHPGGMRAIGTSSKGTLVYIGDMGAFRSTDQGISWIHYPNAFPAFKKENVGNHNLGPKILEDGNGNLLAFSQVVLNGMKYPNRMWCWVSADDGRSWEHREITLPENYHALEPATCLMDGTLCVLGRYHDPVRAYDPETKLYSLMQMSAPVGELDQLAAQLTNIHTTHASDVLAPLCGASKAQALGGFWSQDTGDIFYNPVSKRLEIVVTNRTGGGQGAEDDITLQTLNLWSIDPSAFKAGSSEWRFEATLLQRHIMDVTKQFDGMHPAASVIDEANGVQHIFVYLGYYHGPTGVFRITRPLDTGKVRDWWASVERKKTPSETRVARNYFSALGQPVAPTQGAPAELIRDGLILQLDGSSVVLGENRQGVRWNDLGRAGHDFLVASGCRGAGVDEKGLNGLPVVVFKKAEKNRWQLDAKKAGAFNPGEGEMTFLIVCRPGLHDGWQSLVRKGNFRDSGHEGYNISAINGGKGRLVSRVATATGDRSGVQSAIEGERSDFSIYVSVLDGAGQSAYLNGVEGSAFGSKQKYSGAVDPVDSLFLGVGFDGEIAEVLVYDRALDVDEINRASAYLKRKYDLQSADIYKVD